MLLGFLYGIGAAFFWSLTNIIDKHLTHKHAGDGNVWGIVVLSCFFPLVLLPICLYFSDVTVARGDAAILMLSGALMVSWIYFYLKALTEDDTSVVMTLLVLAPLFSLIFGTILLGETLSAIQMMGGALLVGGALIVSYEPHEKKFKRKLIVYAVLASAILGLLMTLFKFSSFEDNIWPSMYWRSIGMIVSGLLLCFLITPIRQRFHHFVTQYLRKGLTLNTANESLTLAGDTVFAFAILLAPVALVQTTEAYQPVFIIGISFILSQLGIQSVAEDYSKTSLLAKIVGIILVSLGSVVLISQG